MSTNVPLTHWSYDAIETLADAGLVQSGLLSTKPFSRLEMARLLVEARENVDPNTEDDSLYVQLLDRLEREFSYERERLSGSGDYSGSYLKPVEDPYVRYGYSQKTPDYENQQGDRFSSGSNMRAGLATRGQINDRVAFYLHPEYEDPSSQNRVELIEGYGKIALGPVAVQLGKDSMWWGPAHHGSMLMSTNAEPMNLLKVSNDQPILLPSFLRFLGPMRAVYFLSELESNRTIPDAKLTGVRLDFKPTPNFEVGLNRTIMFGGQGNAPINWKHYMQIFWPNNIQGEENQLAGFDWAWRLPLPGYLPARSVKLYGEWAGEDSAGFSQYRPLFGFKFIDLFKQAGKTDLRIEYVKTHVSHNPSTFYNHHLFQSGYTYEGRVMGHHVGSGARDIYAHLTHWLSPSLRVGLSADWWEGMAADPRPQAEQTGVDLLWFGPKNLQCQAQYRYEYHQNQTATFNGDNHILDVMIGLRF
ncbi:MAG: capsule assembly Wzi family protein [Planctomycetes bacterium]|nr:capsule assembly Wzi family protein [Planctomycetota bacterium]